MTGQPTGNNVATLAGEDPAREDPPDQDVHAVLAIKPFRWLWISLGLSSLGDWLGLLAAMAMAGQLASGSYSGQLFAVSGVLLLRLAPAVLLGPIAGVVADRWNRRVTLVVGDLLRFALFASIAVIGTLQWLYIATVLIECVALFWGPAKDAALPNLVPRRRLEAANRLSLVATYGTAPIAAALYALLAVLTDALSNYGGPTVDPITVAMWINALTFLISGLVIWRLDVSFTPGAGSDHAPANLDEAPRRSMWRTLVDGYRFLGGTPLIRGLVVGLLGAFAAGGFVVGLAPAFVQELGAGQAGFGVLFGALFVGLALGMWMGPKVLITLPRRKLFGAALMIAGLLLILMASVPNMALAAVFTVGVGFCAGLAWVTGYTLIGLEVDDEMRGRTFAFVGSASRVILVLVLALAPTLAAAIGQHEVRFPWGGRMVHTGVMWVLALAGLIGLVTGAVAYRQMAHAGESSSLRRSVYNLIATHRPESSTPRQREYPGYFIAFEGGDGTGKSTQARALAEWLRDDQGHDVVLTREPGATSLGVELRKMLLAGEDVGPRVEALLFAADRAHHVESLIRPALARGAVVITDRYVDSSIAYQGVGRGLSERDIASISQWATDGLTPDLSVVLDIPPEIARVRRANDPKRSGEDRMESQPEDFHASVREAFLSLASRHPQRYLVLDGSDDRDDVQGAVRRRVRDLVPISPKRRAELTAKLAAESEQRERRAAAESEVLRMDAELRGRSRDEARAQELAAQRARSDAERALREETEGQERRARLTAFASVTEAATEDLAEREQPAPVVVAEPEAVDPDVPEPDVVEVDLVEAVVVESDDAEVPAAEPDDDAELDDAEPDDAEPDMAEQSMDAPTASALADDESVEESPRAWFVPGRDPEDVRWAEEVIARPTKPVDSEPFPSRVETLRPFRSPAAVVRDAQQAEGTSTRSPMVGPGFGRESAATDVPSLGNQPAAATAPLSVAMLAAAVAGTSSEERELADSSAPRDDASGASDTTPPDGENPSDSAAVDPAQAAAETAEMSTLALRAEVLNPKRGLAEEIFGIGEKS